jgi:hypothetical protein
MTTGCFFKLLSHPVIRKKRLKQPRNSPAFRILEF